MATTHRPTRPDERVRGSSVPPISPDELALRNRDAIALLASWIIDGDEQEQRETMAVLREALGEHRTMSTGGVFR